MPDRDKGATEDDRTLMHRATSQHRLPEGVIPMDRQTLTDLREELHSRAVKMRGLLDNAEREFRDLTSEEAEEFDRMADEHQLLEGRIKRGERSLGIDGAASRPVPHQAVEPRGIGGAELHAGGEASSDRAAFGPEARMADWQARHGAQRGGISPEEAREVNLDRVLGAWISGSREGLEDIERRVLAEGVDATGGFTVPEILGASLIDRTRNATKVITAGALTVPVTSDQHSIARLAGGVTGAWRAENAAITESDPSFERVTFRPKSHAVLVRLSRELAEDMLPSAFSGVTNELAQSVGLAVDFAALRGSGTGNQPQGVRNQPGVELKSLGADGVTPTNYDFLIDAVAGIQAANIDPTAFLYSSRTAATLAKLKATDGQPLTRPPLVTDRAHHITNQVPNNLTQGMSAVASEVFTGYWPDLLIGVRSNLRLEVLKERFADNLQIGLIVHVRLDVQLAHTAAFNVTIGVLA